MVDNPVLFCDIFTGDLGGLVMRYGFFVLCLTVVVGCDSSNGDGSQLSHDLPDLSLQEEVLDLWDLEDIAPIEDAQDNLFDKFMGDVPSDEGAEDLLFPDIIPDKTPPEVIKVEPADGELGVEVPFVVRVQFSEPIRFESTIDKNTFKVLDVDGNPIQGTRTYEKETNTVVFTPDKNARILLASPYHIYVSELVQDLSGNRMKSAFTSWFATAIPKDLERYEQIAARYSPIIYQRTGSGLVQGDYLTSFDFDKDWDGSNNFNNLKQATEIPSFIYYDVVETKSHYFVRYLYFYPYHFGTGEKRFGNEMSGATVVVQKYPQEAPIAVVTYFAVEDQEEMRSYVTSDSGIVKDKPHAYYGVNFVFERDVLFPDGHYLAYLTSGTHESCLWVHTTKENPLDLRCQLTQSEKENMTVINYVYGGGDYDSLKKPFPASRGDVRYAMKKLIEEFWVRRDQVGPNKVFGSTDKYEPPEGRPGNNLLFPDTFVDPVDPTSPYKGRAPWAWKWQTTALPINGQPFYQVDLPKGTYFIDPAYFFMKRHRLTADFNSATKTGYSLDYCFNPYLLIDQRYIDPDCRVER